MEEATLELLIPILNGSTDLLKCIMSLPRRWMHVSRLRQRGIITSSGAPKLRDGPVLALLRQVEGRRVEVILRGSNERVFLSLAVPGTVADIVRRTGLSDSTVYRALRALYAVGAAKNTNGVVRLDDTLVDLARAMNASGENSPIYRDAERTLWAVRAGTACPGSPTAFSAFAGFGIKYETSLDYYAEQDDAVDMYNILVHALLAAAKMNNVEAVSMALVFYLKHMDEMDIRRIRITAQSFGIASVWRDAESYIRGHAVAGVISFQPWDVFLEKAKSHGIDPKEYRRPSAVESLLQDLGGRLDRPVQIYLCGDENMQLKGLRNSTARYDIMVESRGDFEIVCETLSRMPGWSVDDIRNDMDEPYPFGILSHQNLPKIRIYAKSMMGDVFLTNSMAKMANHVEFGRLGVHILRNEHVFVIKAGTRPLGDVEGMAALVSGQPVQPRRHDHGGFDWNVVREEIKLQEKNDTREELLMVLFETMCHLESMGVRVPILGEIRRSVTDSSIIRMARSGWCPLEGIVYRFTESYIHYSYVRNRVNALIRRGLLKKRHEGRRVLVCGEALFPHPGQRTSRLNMHAYLLWRFCYREPSEPKEFGTLVDHVRNRGHRTIGDIDKAVVQGVFDLPYNPPPSPAASIMMCLRS